MLHDDLRTIEHGTTAVSQAGNMESGTSVTAAERPARRTTVMIRHHGFRRVSTDEVVAAVGGMAALESLPTEIEVDTSQFAEDINARNWGRAHGEVWSKAQEIKRILGGADSPRLIYAGGMPEVSLAVALGAYVEEFWPVEAYDYVEGTLRWPTSEQTLRLAAAGLPVDRVTTEGPAVLRVEISYRVEDAHVDEAVPEGQRVADVRIAPEGTSPALNLVRSPADVAEVRSKVRQAIATLVDRRPGITSIHLFIAAPVSACLVTGQELRLRNHPQVQTYRFRSDPQGGKGNMTEAILLTPGGPAVADVPLTLAEVELAARLRSELWDSGVRDVRRYADRKRREADAARETGATERWYSRLLWNQELRRLHPFPALPPIYDVVPDRATIDTEPFAGEGFGFQTARQTWRVNDRFSVRLMQRFGNIETAKTLVRIFLFHEYLHEVHGITKETYRQVGKFPNGLERADYMCDLYGILHELDWEADEDRELRTDFEHYRRRLTELIDLVVRSYWVFEPQPPHKRWEVRRIRRYMNWYWQWARIHFAREPLQAAAIVARQPIVELAGLATSAEGRRHYAYLDRLDHEVDLELGIVLDDERLARIQSSVNTPLDELASAFIQQNHEEIKQIFERVFAEAQGRGHALPAAEDVP
jgi:hypothetical protein